MPKSAADCSALGHQHLPATQPHYRFLQRPISVCIFENGLHVPDGRPFLMDFSGFLQGDAVQEHLNTGLTAVCK
jgi:hypothetical protein